MRMRKQLSTLFKIIVTVVALVIVLREVDVETIWQTIRRANGWWIFAGFMLFNLSMGVRAIRWWLLLRSVGKPPPLSRLIELYFVGNFFNMALPSGFGGDVVRVVEAARDVPTDIATGTVLLDRLVGLVVLFIVALVVLPFQTAVFSTTILWLTIVGAVAGTLGILLLVDGRLIRWGGSWLPRFLNPNENGTAGKLYQAVQGCGWTAVLQAMGVSVLFNLVLAGWWLTSGLALGVSVSYLFYLFIMPLVAVPLLIPSVGGLGPRELIVPTLFVSIGVGPDTAVAISLIVFTITRLSGLVGAPLYLLSLLRQGSQQPNEQIITPE